ncbi:MAG: type II toxin-antitoxin system VapB family antitoxin [Gemmatimonadaceae bacterium]
MSTPPLLDLRVESAEAARLAQEISELTSEPIDEIVVMALKERLSREKRKRAKARREKHVEGPSVHLADRIADYPVVDDRAPAAEPDWYDAFPPD